MPQQNERQALQAATGHCDDTAIIVPKWREHPKQLCVFQYFVYAGRSTEAGMKGLSVTCHAAPVFLPQQGGA
jgi:hypothetical protein